MDAGVCAPLSVLLGHAVIAEYALSGNRKLGAGPGASAICVQCGLFACYALMTDHGKRSEEAEGSTQRRQ